MAPDQKIQQFLASGGFGVAGASTNRQKYGNKVLRCYVEHGYPAVPINPRADSIEGIACVGSVDHLPDEVNSLSIITPPAITVEVVRAAIAKGIEHIWMQPGADHPDALELCREANVNCISGGPCLLVELGFSGDY